MMDESTGAACLLIACLHRAVLDARRGDDLAAAWLRDSGPGLLEWLDIAPCVSRARIDYALTRKGIRRLHARANTRRRKAS